MDGEVRNGGTLQRIVALLLSLALVAERAAGRSWPVRFLALVVLRRIEAVATSFVVREIEAAGADAADFPWLDEAAESGSSPLDAAFLALRFRLLAEVLELCRVAHRSGNIFGNQARSGDISGIWGGNAPRLPVFLIVRLPGRRFHRLPRSPDST
jgi:hypothetical protein